MYSPENYVIKTDVVYFQGDYDPRATLSSALRHFHSSPKGNKYFFKIKDSGHFPLSNKSKKPDCFKKIWEHISHKNYDFQEILNKNGECI